jgi:two-component system, NtrC family, nitrogen regulation sensor histidine kinase NtrY
MKTILVKDLIEKITLLMRPEIKKTTIHFEAHCDFDYLSIEADEEMIEQVLINLVKNSIESLHDSPSGKIELTGLHNGNSVLIQVADNGPGIIKEAMAKIFVPFFTTKKTGSGIGLSLSRQIMQMHQGNLTVESEPGVRTVFTLKF